MPASCDIQRQVVVKDGKGKKATILDEKLIPCMNPRVIILPTTNGRLGFCTDHLEHYKSLDKKGQKEWLRLRHGQTVAGPPEIEVPEGT
jgi:hypothetical protein